MLNVPFHRASSDNNRSPTSEVIPDLIQSTGAHWSGTNGMSSKSPSPATSVRSSSSSENCSSGSLSDKGQQLGSDSDEAINETSEAGVAGATAMAAASNRASDKNVEMEILRTLNDQINRAVRQGGKSYLYEVRENDDETWC